MKNPLRKVKRDYGIGGTVKRNKNKIVEVRELGKSLGGLSIPLLVITNFNCTKEQMKMRKIVLI